MLPTKLLFCLIAAACWVLLLEAAHIKSHFDTSNNNKLVIYECSFDSLQDADCSLATTTLSKRIGKIQHMNVSELDYTITDVSSIVKPTSDGSPCQIPFAMNGQTYYHCTADTPSKCETSQGIAECAEGRFLGGKIDTRFTDKFRIKSIKLSEQEDSYELTYYYFIYCQDNVCESGNDYINVTLYDEKNVKLAGYSHTDVLVDDRIEWRRQTQFVKLERGKVIDIEIEFRRPFLNRNTAYFGVDSISLAELPDGFSTTTPTPTTPIEDLSENEIVYECDFDYNTDCDAVIESDDYKTQVVVKSTVLDTITSRNYQITDVSSITKPTINNNTCQIPYQFSNLDHYHCNTAFECQIAGVFPVTREKCFDQGYFLNAKLPNTGSQMSANTTFPRIDIDQDGYYAIEYFVFMYCDRLSDAECKSEANGTDFISLYWTNNDDSIQSREFSFMQKKWSRQRYDTYLKQGTLVLSVIFDRVVEKPDLIVQYGFDELKIYKLNISSATPASTNVITTTTAELPSIITDYPCLDSQSNNNCTVEIANNYGANIEYKSFNVISDECVVSSYSSIITPTKQDKKCRESFTYNNTEHTTCALIDSKLQCYTNDNTLDECTPVPFIFAGPRSPDSNNNNNEYQATISVRPHLTQIGKYRLNFHAVMYCCQCVSSSAYIRVFSIGSSDSRYATTLFNLTSHDLMISNDWNSVQADLDVADLDFEIRIVIGKYGADLRAEHVGIDNLKLTYISENKTTSEIDWMIVVIVVSSVVGFVLTVALITCICDVACKKLTSDKKRRACRK